MQKINSLEKSLILEEIEGRRRRGGQKLRWLDVITDSIDMNLSKLWETVKDRVAWCAVVQRSQRVGHNSTSKQQQQYQLFLPQIVFSYIVS